MYPSDFTSNPRSSFLSTFKTRLQFSPFHFSVPPIPHHTHPLPLPRQSLSPPGLRDEISNRPPSLQAKSSRDSGAWPGGPVSPNLWHKACFLPSSFSLYLSWRTADASEFFFMEVSPKSAELPLLCSHSSNPFCLKAEHKFPWRKVPSWYQEEKNILITWDREMGSWGEMSLHK